MTRTSLHFPYEWHQLSFFPKIWFRRFWWDEYIVFLLTPLLFKTSMVSFEVWGNVLTLSSLVQKCRNDNYIYIFYIKIERSRKERDNLFKSWIQSGLICIVKKKKKKPQRIAYGLEGWIFYYFSLFCWSSYCDFVLQKSARNLALP